MEPITVMMMTQLTEYELVIFMLIQSGMGYRDLARRLGTSHYYISKMYHRTEGKINALAAAGLWSTPIDPVDRDGKLK